MRYKINCLKPVFQSKDNQHLSSRDVLVVTWEEVQKDLSGSWAFKLPNGRGRVFSTLMRIDPMTNLVEIVLFETS